MTELLKSTSYKLILGSLIGLILLFGAFQLGVLIGIRKTRHASGMCQNYDRMFFTARIGHPGFGGPGENFPFPPQMPEAFGAFGKVVSVSGTSLVITGKGNTEQTVLVTSSTAIRAGQADAKLEDIKPNTDVAVFGKSDTDEKGNIDARLIRIFPPAPTR